MSTNDNGMHRGLKNRHIQMIALGGAIGTGLFYGSASTIQLTGPSITVSYLIGGLVIFMIMRMLGEMSVDEPVSGSFSHFANKYWGEFPGFLSGWNYWFNYIVVSMAELTAVGIYVNYWFPDVPTWVSALVCLVVITLINLISVGAFGEFEFWFAIVKVAAVIGMIVFGLILIFFGLGGEATGFSNLWKHGGFFPNGMVGLIFSLVPVMFSFGGIELIGITAGEADNPKKSIPKAINQVMWRILIFYVGALTVMMIIYPWNQVGMDGSPFVQIFSGIGIPAAATLLNVVVLTAALSVYNSGIYSNGRMLHSLAQQGNAPKILSKLNKRGIPVVGILASSGVTLIAVALNYVLPGEVFTYLMAVAIIAGIINWSMIIITNLKFRKYKIANGEEDKIEFKSFFYPYSNYICLAFLAVIVVLMAFTEGMKEAVLVLPIWLIVLYVSFKIKKSREAKN